MNNQPRCRYAGSDQPRVVVGRHGDECEGSDHCGGCLPCGGPHCRVCGIEHTAGACAGCVGAVREDLAEIVRLYESLPDEVEARGIDTEALSLLGPAADPEARGHLRASVAAGRVAPEAEGEIPRDKDGNEIPDPTPLWTLGTWSMIYRDAFGHDEPTTLASVQGEAGYLTRNLTEAAEEQWVPFDQFAQHLRLSIQHLERVLHDGEQVDRTRVTCVNEHCRRRPMLERKFSSDEAGDRWACPSCHHVYTSGEYQRAMARQLVHKGAEKYVPLRDAVSTLVVQGRSDRTVRKWLAPPKQDELDVCQNDDCRLEWERGEHEHCPRCGSDLAPVVRLTGDPESVVGGFCEIDSHRVWVWWPDLWSLHMTTKTRARGAAA